MADPARVLPPALDQELEQALAICGGDPLKALRVTLIANAFLEARLDQLTAQVSAGFSRGRVVKAVTKKKSP